MLKLMLAGVACILLVACYKDADKIYFCDKGGNVNKRILFNKETKSFVVNDIFFQEILSARTAISSVSMGREFR